MEKKRFYKKLALFCAFFILTSTPLYVHADSVKLLEDPHEAWQARINLIENAQKTIDVEYYAIAPDTAGKVFTGLLYEAANRGVKVHILVGGLTHVNIPDEAIGTLIEHPNIEIRFYHSMKEWYFPSHWVKTLHDKTLLVDNSYLITGGRNIADKYFDMTPPEKKQTIDRDILIVGDENKENIPLQVKEYFNELWNSKEVEVTPTELFLTHKCMGTTRFLFADFFICHYNKWRLNQKIPQKKEDFFTYIENYKNKHPEQFNTNYDWIEESKPVFSISFAHDPTDGTKSQYNGTAQALAQELRKAKKSILYFTPYIIKTDVYMETARIAQANNVAQTVLTNSPYSGANLFGIAGTEFYYDDFAQYGLTYWIYQGFHSLHHKTYIIDDHITISSTYNYDPRSANLNTEMLFIIDDKKLTEEFKEANGVFFNNALEIDENGHTIPRNGVTKNTLPFYKRILVAIIKIFMPLIYWII